MFNDSLPQKVIRIDSKMVKTICEDSSDTCHSLHAEDAVLQIKGHFWLRPELKKWQCPSVRHVDKLYRALNSSPFSPRSLSGSLLGLI